MPRGLDAAMAAALANGTIAPVFLAELTFASGKTRAWSGLGDLVWNGKTFSGVGSLGAVGPITETSAIEAEGTTVTLYGLSQIVQPLITITPSAPLPTPAPGELVAWAAPRQSANTGYGAASSPPGLLAPGVTQAVSTLTTASLDFLFSRPLGGNVASVLWTEFELSASLPVDAVISGIYPVITVASYTSGTGFGYLYTGEGLPLGQVGVGAGQDFPGPVAPGTFVGASIGTSLSALPAQGIEASLNSTLESDSPGCSLSVANPGFAVYYTSASGVIPPASMLDEVLEDANPGGPATVWFGLWSTASGGFIGTPYPVFVGTLDEATIDEAPTGTSLVLALENRLRNLQRAGGRLYTAADQKLSFPNDSGFNFVEVLQEISLIWGS